MKIKLSRQQIKDIGVQLYRLNELRPDLEIAAQAGVDVAELAARLEHSIKVLEALRSNYTVGAE